MKKRLNYTPDPHTGIGNNCGNCKRREQPMDNPTCTECRRVEKETRTPFNKWEKRSKA